jgi:hypothetical protein
VSQPIAEDTRDLAAFGYKQVLDRTLGSFSSFAASFSAISVLTGLFQTFYMEYRAGGSAFFWTWPVVFCGQFTVALCFAEMAACCPLSRGVYQWSRCISSCPARRLAGWVYACGSVISLAAVALALDATPPQIAPAFDLISDSTRGSSTGTNAVLLGCLLIVLCLGPLRGATGNPRVMVAGGLYYQFFQRKKAGILASHAAQESLDHESTVSKNPTIEAHRIRRLAAGEQEVGIS